MLVFYYILFIFLFISKIKNKKVIQTILKLIDFETDINKLAVL